MDLLEEHQRKTKEYIVSAILWLLTSILGGAIFLAGRRVVLSTYTRFFLNNPQATGPNASALMNILVALPLTCLVIAIVIGGFEYHLRKKRVGSEASHKLFARTLALEAGILLLAWFI